VGGRRSRWQTWWKSSSTGRRALDEGAGPQPGDGPRPDPSDRGPGGGGGVGSGRPAAHPAGVGAACLLGADAAGEVAAIPCSFSSAGNISGT
jgi:hypothetical protein